MKKLDLFQLRNMSRAVIDSYMIDNGYKIESVDFTGTVENQIVTYNLDSILDLSVKCHFYKNVLLGIQFC